MNTRIGISDQITRIEAINPGCPLWQRSAEVHAANIKWWQDPATQQPIQRNKLELLALAISEMSECLEGERKNLMDDKLPHRKMAEVELADCYIRLLDFAEGFGIGVYEYKLVESIPDNKGEAIFRIMDLIADIANSNNSIWLAVTLATIEAYAAKWGYDLAGAFEDKMKFNATREDHTHEARIIAGGKQF